MQLIHGWLCVASAACLSQVFEEFRLTALRRMVQMMEQRCAHTLSFQSVHQ